jgi:hypothetical protein
MGHHPRPSSAASARTELERSSRQVCAWVSLPLSCTCMHDACTLPRPVALTRTDSRPAPSGTHPHRFSTRAQWHSPAPILDPRRAQQYDDSNFLIQAWRQYVASLCMQKCHGHTLPVGASRPLPDSASDQSLPMPFATARTEGHPVPHGQPLLVTSEQCCPLLSTADMVTQKLTCT